MRLFKFERHAKRKQGAPFGAPCATIDFANPYWIMIRRWIEPRAGTVNSNM